MDESSSELIEAEVATDGPVTGTSVAGAVEQAALPQRAVQHSLGGV